MIQFEPIFKVFENANRTEENLPQLFNEIAEYFLLKGYFLVNEIKRVYICDVEFYYHEEKEGGVKDWIMYHRDNHPNSNDRKTVAYFKPGQFNAHTSGIDITFENEDQEYRAGMLIRGFKVVTEPLAESSLGNNDSIFKYDSRSTYFYEALLNSPMTSYGFTIKWIEEDNLFNLTKCSIHYTFRKNVPYYESENMKCLWLSESCGSYFISGKSKFKQCMRNWRFYLSNKTTKK